MKIKRNSESLIAQWLVRSEREITDEEVNYYRHHPDQIDEVTAPINIHKIFLIIGSLVGIIFIGISKLVKLLPSEYTFHEMFHELLVDIVFEIGVSLLGAAIVAYSLGVVLNQQQESAKQWRKEIRKKIKEIHD